MNNKFLLIFIIFLAAALRLPFLDSFPSGFSGDEAQQGYSAYSIFKTGKDEWGQFLPIFPRGFGDFKPPLYTYLTIPSVGIFGLNEFGVRVPAATLGIFSVLVLYFLARQIFKDEKIALWAAFLMSINPWHIQVSRTAFEGGAGILFFSLGLLMLLKGLENQKILILSSIFLGLTLYSYHSWKVFSFIFIFGLLWLFKKKILNFKNWLFFLLLLIFILPIIFNLNRSLTRASDVGIFSNRVVTDYFSNKTINPLPYAVDRIFDNKVLYISNQIMKNYLSYFSPGFFFIGDRSSESYLNFPNFPLFYPIEILFFGVGIYFLIFKKQNGWKIILVWILLAPIPPSLAQGFASANRGIILLPLAILISALGAQKALEKFNQKLAPIFILILAISLLFFLRFYFFILPQNTPESLRPLYKQIFKKVLEQQPQYDQIVISKAFTQPQIFIAFYGKVDPTTFQNYSKDWLRYEKSDKLYVDQLESWNLGKFYFEDINWAKKEALRKNALVVSTPHDFPSNVQPILDVQDSKGQLIYRLVPTNQ